MAQQIPPPSNIPLPPGWEAKLNEASRRYYFVDHVNKSTQWEDPRLTHPFIWGPNEKNYLQSLKESFPEYPELILRENLLKTNFNVNEAKNELRSLAGEKPKPRQPSATERHLSSPKTNSVASTTPKKQLSPSQSPKVAASTPKVDEFAFMSVKSKFPEVPNFIIQEVLTNFNQDEEKSCKELSSMGYSAKKHAAIVEKYERIEMEKEEKEKFLEKQRNEALNQLKLEFSSFPDDTVRQVFQKANFDTVESRSMLRQLETKAKLEKLLSATTFTKEEVGRERASSSETKKAKQKSSKQQQQQEKSRSTTPPTITVEGENEKRTDLQPKSDEISTSSSSSKTEQQTETVPVNAGIVASERKSLAVGSQSSLRNGPNKDLLMKRSSESRGPDPALRRGPCKEIYSGANSTLLLASS